MIKNSNKHKVTFYLEQDQVQELLDISKESGFSQGLIMRLALKDYVKKYKKEQ